MSLAEIHHRLGERRARRTGRRLAGWEGYRLAAVRIVPLAIDFGRLAEIGRSCGDDWAAVWDAAGEGRWQLLGQTWPGRIEGCIWHLDPVSGRHWPSADYCFDIDFRHQRGLGDIKYVWELNRLQFLPPIAALARLRGDVAAERYCVETLLDWAEGNQPFNGVNWASGIELALRAISMVLTVSLLGVETLSPNERDRIGSILNAHAVWLERYPSRYSSANNHLEAEAAALYLLGTLVPSLPGAERYRAYGRAVLIAEAGRQILSDGVGAEQSPTYTAFTLELYAVALAAAASGGEAFPTDVAERLGKAVEALAWITDAGGKQPRIGDDDEGKVIGSGLGREVGYVTSVIGGRAAHLRDAVCVLPARRDAPVGVRSFDAGGYTVWREQVAGRAAMLVFDHGPLGYLSIAAHGHADALAVWLHLDGRPVLVDAGTYLYHAGGAERDRLRGTAAHNTLEINGANQSVIAGPFNWSRKAKAWRVIGAPEVTARHDGYVRRFGVVHQRTVAREPWGFVLTDRLEGPLGRVERACLRYHFAPDIVVRMESGEAVLEGAGGDMLRMALWSGNDPLAVTLERVEISPAFGGKVATTVLVCVVPMDAFAQGSVRTVMEIVPGAGS